MQDGSFGTCSYLQPTHSGCMAGRGGQGLNSTVTFGSATVYQFRTHYSNWFVICAVQPCHPQVVRRRWPKVAACCLVEYVHCRMLGVDTCSKSADLPSCQPHFPRTVVCSVVLELSLHLYHRFQLSCRMCRTHTVQLTVCVYVYHRL